MPCYEYRCASNGRTVEVRHAMDESLATWGELTDRAGVGLGSTPAGAPVERLLSAPVPWTGSPARSDSAFQGCGQGCACARNA
jgi:hypothetical protein